MLPGDRARVRPPDRTRYAQKKMMIVSWEYDRSGCSERRDNQTTHTSDHITTQQQPFFCFASFFSSISGSLGTGLLSRSVGAVDVIVVVRIIGGGVVMFGVILYPPLVGGRALPDSLLAGLRGPLPQPLPFDKFGVRLSFGGD
jgi:hypothetical protein